MKRPSVVFYVIVVSLLYHLEILYLSVFALISCVLLSYTLEKVLAKALQFAEIPENCAVVITGTSSGFGKSFAMELALKHGVMVFAGVRKQSDGNALIAEFYEEASKLPSKPSGLILPVLMDVTNKEALSQAVKIVSGELSKTDKILYAIISNAGVQCFDPLETSPSSRIAWAFDVNVFGSLNFIKSFIPLLRMSRLRLKFQHPRVILIGSVASTFTPTYFGGYSASKHAITAIADALRPELLSSAGILTTIIEPGSFDTEIINPNEVFSKESMEHSFWGPRLQFFSKCLNMLLPKLPPPTAVTETVVQVLLARFPGKRVFVGSETWLIFALQYIPESVIDLTMTGFMSFFY